MVPLGASREAGGGGAPEAGGLRGAGGVVGLVNTQESNVGAVALYRRLGFTFEPEQLTVLSWGR